MIKLGGILAETTKLLGISSRLEDEKILVHWRSVLREDQLKNTEFLYIKRDTLYIGTTSPSWTHHMTINKRNLLEELNKLTSKKIKDIRFSSSGATSKKSSSFE